MEPEVNSAHERGPDPGGPAPGADGRSRPSGDLEGLWRVERVGGLLPPMAGVWKLIGGGGGVTCVGPLPAWPFRVERRGEGFVLVYRPPFSALVDEVRPGPEGTWSGRSTLDGRELGRFRMRRIGRREHTTPPEGEQVADTQRLRGKLVEYVEYVHALEQNVLLQLDSLIPNTRDPELKAMFRAHKEETRRQRQRLRERRVALGRVPGLSSARKDLVAIAAAQAKGVVDVLRTDKAAQNARDAFVTEHAEIAAYELLGRLAERAGDPETAEVARVSPRA